MKQYTPPSDEISLSATLITFFTLYLVAIVVLMFIEHDSPGLMPLLLVLFPAGLLYNEHFEVLGMVSGYFVYVALFIGMLKYRSRKRIYFSGLGILFVVLLLTIRGCTAFSFYPAP